jgi:hypothetical protein
MSGNLGNLTLKQKKPQLRYAADHEYKHSKEERESMRNQKAQARLKTSLESSMRKVVNLLYKQKWKLATYIIAFKFHDNSNIRVRASSNLYQYVWGTTGMTRVFEDAERLGDSDRHRHCIKHPWTPSGFFPTRSSVGFHWLSGTGTG